jgi:hypothetical protein
MLRDVENWEENDELLLEYFKICLFRFLFGCSDTNPRNVLFCKTNGQLYSVDEMNIFEDTSFMGLMSKARWKKFDSKKRELIGWVANFFGKVTVEKVIPVLSDEQEDFVRERIVQICHKLSE